LHTRAVPPPIPTGPGLFGLALRIAPGDEVLLWGFLLGEEGLASAHGRLDDPGRVVLVTTDCQRGRLRDWLAEIALELPSIELEPGALAVGALSSDDLASFR
jgi:hypothetical protein